MPYEIMHEHGDCSGWAVVKESDGKVMGCHETETEAKAQLAAIEANEERAIDETEQKAHSLFRNFWRGLVGLFAEKQERALSMEILYDKVWQLAAERYPAAWLLNVFADDNNDLFAILQQDGDLYRSALTVTDGATVEMADWVEVKLDFPQVQTRTVIRQQADGRFRWISRSATSVLNRVAEIDSTALFDNFVRHIEETGEYPIRQFYHLGEQFRTGQADFVARDGNVLLTSGLYDDTALARAEIEAIAKEPDYWGESIGYHPLDRELVEIARGIQIPVYIDGVLKEISVLPEDSAANLFTAVRLKERTVLNGKIKETFVKLFGDEAAAEQWLAENVDELNRSIEASGLVTRNQEEEAPAPEEPAQETPPVEIDDTVIEAVVARMQAVENEEILRLRATVDELDTKLTGVTEQATQALTDIVTRLEVLEQDEEAKKRQWQEDMPRNAVATKVIYRPRERHKDEVEEVVETAAQRAERLRPKGAW